MNKYFKKIPNVEFAYLLIDARKYVSYDYIARRLHVGKYVISKYAASVYDADDNQIRSYAKHASPERQEEIIEIILDELEEQAVDHMLSNKNINDYEKLIKRCFNFLIPDTALRNAASETEACDIIFDINDLENGYTFNFLKKAVEDWELLKNKNISDIIWFNDNFNLIFDEFRCDIDLIQSECYKAIDPNYTAVIDNKVLDSEGCIKTFDCLDMAIFQNELNQKSKSDIELDKDQKEILKRSLIRKAAMFYMYRSRPYDDDFDEYASYIVDKSPEAIEYPLYHDWSFIDFFDEIMRLEADQWINYAKFRLYLDRIL